MPCWTWREVVSAGFDFDVLVVGEALTDIVISDETYVEHVGGSPDNVALGLGRCGVKSAFLTQIANDSRGRAIAAHLRASGVDVLTESFTARKTSTAIARIAADGQATYAFNVEWNTLSPVEPVKARVVHTGSIATFLEPGGASVRQLLRQTRAESITFDPNIRPVFLRKVAGRSARRRAIISSPIAPRSHAAVLCGSSERASMSPPSFGWFARIRCSRFSFRRSNSRRADPPATLGCASPVPVAQSTHRTVLEPRS